jgi:hypothetical protein
MRGWNPLGTENQAVLVYQARPRRHPATAMDLYGRVWYTPIYLNALRRRRVLRETLGSGGACPPSPQGGEGGWGDEESCETKPISPRCCLRPGWAGRHDNAGAASSPPRLPATAACASRAPLPLSSECSGSRACRRGEWGDERALRIEAKSCADPPGVGMCGTHRAGRGAALTPPRRRC